MTQRRRKGTGSVKQLEDGTYLVRLRQGNKEKRRKVSSKREANQILKDLQDEFQREQENGVLINPHVTVDSYFNQFLKFKQASVSSTTYRRIESTVDTHIKPYFKKVKFNNLSADMIQQRLNEAYDNGISYSSVKKIFEAFNGCYKYAISRGDILPKDNPMIAVTMIAKSKFDQKNNEPRYLRSDEWDNERERFYEEALRKYKNGAYVYRYGPAMIFMMNTGIRESEMCALSYEDVKLDERYIQVRNSAASLKIDGKYKVIIRENTTKWDSGRYVPLNDTAFQMLTEMSKMFHGNLIISTVHETVLPPVELTKTFNRICKAANITENMDGVGAHCLRHTYATVLFEQGIDAKTISELLGHSNIQVTLNTYVTVANKMKMKAVKIPKI